MKKQKEEYTVVIVADMHCGSALGLLPPFQKAREFLPLFFEKPEQITECAQNRGQQYLYECWLDAMQKLPPRFDCLILNGDMQHGPFVKNTKINDISLETPSEQANAAYALLAALRARARLCYMVSGSQWHEGQYSESLYLLAEKLKVNKNPITGDVISKALFPRFDNVLLDIAHKVGYSPLYPVSALQTEINATFAKPPTEYGIPDLIIRSHVHQFAECRFRGVGAISTPGWSLDIEHSKATGPARHRLGDIGLAIVKIRPKLKKLGESAVIWEPILYKHPPYGTIDIIKELSCQSRISI